MVFVHAHPDDEALLTAGTMARAVAEGNRVVLIVATDGAAGLTNAEHADDLAAHRQEELSRSAHILGVDRLINLGYADSGLHGEVADGFAHQPKFAIAKLIAAILDDEDCDILIGYDPSGGYGHPDMSQKKDALRAHASQASADGTIRTLAVLTRLPGPIANPILGTEYYVEVSQSERASSTAVAES